MTDLYRYAAFISYSSKDAQFAQRFERLAVRHETVGDAMLRRHVAQAITGAGCAGIVLLTGHPEKTRAARRGNLPAGDRVAGGAVGHRPLRAGE